MRERHVFRRWSQREWASRKRSRATLWVIAVGIVIAVALPILEMLDTGRDEDRWGSIAPLMILAFAVLMSPFGRDRWTTAEPPFDERERNVLARAGAASHQCSVVMIAASFTWFYLASRYGWPMPQTPLDWSGWGFSLVATALTLPVLFAEIMMPLPPMGEDEEFA